MEFFLTYFVKDLFHYQEKQIIELRNRDGASFQGERVKTEIETLSNHNVFLHLVYFSIREMIVMELTLKPSFSATIYHLPRI